jgi:DNA-binding IclR family transcriptional regulator
MDMELNDSDRALLDELAGGRATPSALSDWTGLATQTIHARLNRLVAAGFVSKVHSSGLYELVEDPRENDAT